MNLVWLLLALLGHVHTCHPHLSTCAPLVDLDRLSEATRLGGMLHQLSLRFQAYVFHKPVVCNRMYHWASVPINLIQLSATDLLALASMKNAAKCDK